MMFSLLQFGSLKIDYGPEYEYFNLGNIALASGGTDTVIMTTTSLL